MNTSKQTYFKELDGLRGIAVLLVIVAHYLSQTHFINRFLPSGFIGVTLFFVLSGFLITLILLKNKDRVTDLTSLQQSLKKFYIRRSLRIFPAYYLMIVVTAFIPHFRFWEEGGLWHIFYLSNFYFYIFNVFKGAYGILWTLATEEQFYLFWPTLVLLIPHKYFLRVLAFLVTVSIVFKLLIMQNNNFFGRLLLPGSLDSFCIGAFFASAYLNKTRLSVFLYEKRNVLFYCSIALFIGIHLYFVPRHFSNKWDISFYFFLLSLSLSAWLWVCANGVTNKLGKLILNSSFLTYTGRISYGLYLYQNFMPEFHVKFPHSFMYVSIYFNFLFRLICLYCTASLSFYFFEKKFLRFKEKWTF